ncbi:MAG: isocitrate/isopropylmalate dehydrogenase family protein [Candidatus Caldarchaeum sp.]|nr:isocitrate/isopropylmalate dehydrogenase family protein [Candidatus Caldarchaeum sp.]MDW7977612.1 isocitrate/isopropylmalate dehydrogenase family protein [Candidatus Caldarchaeum sp.]
MYRISVIKGDGIGPHIVEKTTELLHWLGELYGFRMEFVETPAGDRAYEAFGEALPQESYRKIQSSDACLKGPVGETARDVIVYLRQKLDLYANIRPFKNIPGVASKWSGVDLVVVRENTEDLYKSVEDVGKEHAVALLVITRKATERIARLAVDMAYSRKRKLTIVHKANVVKAYQFFRDVCLETAAKNPEVQVNEMYVDNAAYQLIVNPQGFDVLLTPNMFGDILSDEAAGIVGTIGIAGSANIGDSFGLFEPVHGSAPGLDPSYANPTAQILASKMMLEWLGRRKNDRGLLYAAAAVEKGLEQALAAGKFLTPDLGGKAKCAEFVEEVRRNISSGLK